MPFSAEKETSVRFNLNLLQEVKKLMLNDDAFPFNSDLLFVNISSYRFLTEWKNSDDKYEMIKSINHDVKRMHDLSLLKGRTTSWKPSDTNVTKEPK